VGSVTQLGSLLVARYFVPLMVTILAIVLYLLLNKIRAEKVIIKIFKIHIIVFTIFLALSLFANADPGEVFFDSVKLFLAFGISFLVIYGVYYSDIKSIHKTIVFSLIIVTVILCFEVYLRMRGVGYDKALANFYWLKFESPFFEDSNATALYALINFSFFYYYYIFGCYRRNYFFLSMLGLIFILIILTLSRASIVALIALIFFNYYFNKKLYSKLFILFSIIIIIIANIELMISMISFDSSGITKINIYIQFIKLFWEQNILSALVGYGINEGNFIYSYEKGTYSHALVPMIMGQFGILGMVVYFTFFLYFTWLTRGHNLYALFPSFVTGLSYLHPFLETLFVANAFIVGFYLKNRYATQSNNAVLKDI
jgi:hypothetical protein